MCGRYRLKDPEKAFAWLEVVQSFDFLPRFNIAPTQQIPVVTGAGRLEAMRWGIAPARAGEKARPLINVRAETIREKRSFKSAFGKRRCLLPADGFYEWARADKRPHFFTVRGGEPFAIAGIWEPGTDPSQCCLLTTAANALLAPIHDRMPVIVRREDWPAWFTAGELPEGDFGRIAAPYAAGEMAGVAVSALVNSAKLDDPRCCEPAGAGAPPPKLTLKRRAPQEQGAQEQFDF